jgi:HlyD family secretion protein
MKINKQRLLLVAFAAVVFTVIVWTFLPKPIPVEVVRVTRGPVQATVDHEGRTQVKAAEAAKRRAIPALDRTRVASEQAKTELDRAQKPYVEGAMAYQELDSAELKSSTADEELKAADFSVRLRHFNSSRRKPCSAAKRTHLEAEILSGVSENETVLVHPSDKIQNTPRIQERKS